MTDSTRLDNLSHPNTVAGGEPPRRMPVYFLSIGGPNFMENVNHPAYDELSAIGKEITGKVQPKAVIVISAHWEGDPDKIHINVGEDEDIIYDFYGFPPHFYEYKYPNRGSAEVAEKIADKLGTFNIGVERVRRGLDHGVWAGFIVAFEPKKNPLSVPIVQISLYANENLEQHYRLGQALESLRDDGCLIVGAGMGAHNLPDFRTTVRQTGETMPYVYSFDEALKMAVEANPEDRYTEMTKNLIQRDDARKAHPTLDHLLPIYVAAGAAGSDSGRQLWTYPEGSLSWAQYRFGDIENPKPV